VRVLVELLDHQSGEFVEAELFDEVTMDHFLETQREWRPVVTEAALYLAKAGAKPILVPRHFHWDWTKKEADLRMLAITFYGLGCGGALQGLMKLLTVGHTCRLPEQAGKPLVYVDYLEAAPWNIKPLMSALGKAPRYGGIGTLLLEAAVQKSKEEGFKGRLALHSLPTSEQFYLKACGMTAVGRDPAKQNLLWLEYTPEQAERFITRGTA
jgi:hypothetical protein